MSLVLSQKFLELGFLQFKALQVGLLTSGQEAVLVVLALDVLADEAFEVVDLLHRFPKFQQNLLLKRGEVIKLLLCVGQDLRRQALTHADHLVSQLSDGTEYLFAHFWVLRLDHFSLDVKFYFYN